MPSSESSDSEETKERKSRLRSMDFTQDFMLASKSLTVSQVHTPKEVHTQQTIPIIGFYQPDFRELQPSEPSGEDNSTQPSSMFASEDPFQKSTTREEFFHKDDLQGINGLRMSKKELEQVAVVQYKGSRLLDQLLGETLQFIDVVQIEAHSDDTLNCEDENGFEFPIFTSGGIDKEQKFDTDKKKSKKAKKHKKHHKKERQDDSNIDFDELKITKRKKRKREVLGDSSELSE